MSSKSVGSVRPGGNDYGAAHTRVETALNQRDASLRSLNGRVRSISRIETDVAALEKDRAALINELSRVSGQAKKLDKGAAEVSRRLVNAMEDVKSVLDEEGTS